MASTTNVWLGVLVVFLFFHLPFREQDGESDQLALCPPWDDVRRDRHAAATREADGGGKHLSGDDARL